MDTLYTQVYGVCSNNWLYIIKDTIYSIHAYALREGVEQMPNDSCGFEFFLPKIYMAETKRRKQTK